MRADKLNDAVFYYKKALQIKPNYLTALDNLGIALFRLGKIEEALSCYSKALKIDPDCAGSHNNLANILFLRGELDKAVFHYKEVIRIDSKHADAHSNLANVLRIQGKFDEAAVHFKKALDISKRRTKELFVDLLPEKERIIIDLVKNSCNNEKIKWACYEWYLGEYTSRIEVNPNYEMNWSVFLLFSSHEGYPGHHTEFCIKEKKLFHELNQFEHSILILHSPKMIISEGIANLANSILYSNKESAEIGLREFCSDASKEASIEKLILQDKVKSKMPIFWYNFAYHAVVDKYSEEELIQYGKNVEIFSEEGLKTELKRLSNPVYSKNAFLYDLGTNIISNKYSGIPSIKEFQNLLVNPILPSDLT